MLLGLFALGCSTTPPPRGLMVVEPTVPPPTAVEVEDAQRSLADQGLYFGPIDGEFAAETRVAIARFQRQRGLQVTGTLDPETRQALARPQTPEPEQERERAAEQVELPSASGLLEKPPPLPQPPPGALDAVYEEVQGAFLLAASEAEVLLGGTLEQERQSDEAPRLPPRRLEERLAAAEQVIAAARRKAFDRLLAARRDEGWALLPEELEAALRKALADRHLLLRPKDAGWGRDEAAAVRWLGHSLGIPEGSEPSLQLLEALGIDPAPMFGPVDELPRGVPGPNGEEPIGSSWQLR